MSFALKSTYQLPLCVLEVSGADAANFLQQQLTQDVLMQNQEARAFCYCQHQGKVIANGYVLRMNSQLISQENQDHNHKNHTNSNVNQDIFLLIVEKNIADILLKKLSMYVLRAKVKISKTNASIYFMKNALKNQLTFKFLDLDYCLVMDDLIKDEVIDHEISNLNAVNQWQIQQFDLKFPWINQYTSARFTPHMLGLETLSVNFKKGCYPGQEVVARTQYLGKNKKELKIMRINHLDDRLQSFQVEDLSFTKRALKDYSQADSIQKLNGQLLFENDQVIGDIIEVIMIESDYLLMICGQKETDIIA
jgi:tRNA-modifying protein YgfZ